MKDEIGMVWRGNEFLTFNEALTQAFAYGNHTSLINRPLSEGILDPGAALTMSSVKPDPVLDLPSERPDIHSPPGIIS